jgi:hypothetical protein
MCKQTYNRVIEVTYLGQILGLFSEAMEFDGHVLCDILAVTRTTRRRWRRRNRRRLRTRRGTTVTDNYSWIRCACVCIHV